jgi:phosphopantetheinyl transferase
LHERGAECWLSPAERRLQQGMRAPKRRATWLAGRIAAKRLLIESWGEELTTLQPSEIHIETRCSDSSRGQRPAVFVSGQRLSYALSIAHSDHGVLVALANEPGVTLGVDLASQDGPHARRLSWSFTPAERRWLAAAPDRAAARLWAMKEALYKACHDGEGFAPAQIDVAPDAEPVYPGLAPRHMVRSLQSWRIDRHFAALAVVETLKSADRKTIEEDFVLSCEQY